MRRSYLRLGIVALAVGTSSTLLAQLPLVPGEMTVLPLMVFRGYLVAGGSYTRTSGNFIVVGAVDTAPRNGFGYRVGVGAEFRLPFLPAAGVEARLRVTPNALGGIGSLTSIPITARVTF